MKAALLHLLALASLGRCRRSLADFNAGDPFMQYLAPLTFGRDPGPCPDEQNKCTSDFEDLPDSIKAIEVGGFPLRRIIERGVFSVWDLTCSNIELDSLTFSSPSDPFVFQNGVPTELKVRLVVDDIALNCQMSAEGLNVRYRIPAGFFLLPAITSDFRNLEINFVKNDMDGNNQGLQLDAFMRFFSPDFSQSFPNAMDFLTFDGIESTGSSTAPIKMRHLLSIPTDQSDRGGCACPLRKSDNAETRRLKKRKWAKEKTYKHLWWTMDPEFHCLFKRGKGETEESLLLIAAASEQGIAFFMLVWVKQNYTLESE